MDIEIAQRSNGRCQSSAGWMTVLGMILGGMLAHVVEADAVSFNSDIRPILSEHCFACHGPDAAKRKADLRLDTAEGALGELIESEGRAFVPGKLDESVAWQRIVSTDRDEVMPPPKAKLALSEKEKTVLKKWIEQGAKYEAHWAFVPLPAKAAVVANGVEHFVEARLEKEGLNVSPEADRATLARRAYLALTGLPPSAEEADQFTKDASPDAFAKLVDRLLASPHFGERMALDWLDAARYADTNGFSIDGGRNMWLWRDWVIAAFNANMPYDQFLEEQIAGDLVPGATPAQITASGFQRNNMVTHEGGTIPAENLTNYNADRVKTLGESVLGLTLGCAQCHDHKFDPISQRDYYRLFAYFNTLPDKGLDGDGGNNPGPQVKMHTVLKTDEEPALEAQIAATSKRLAEPDAEQVKAWVAEQRERLAKRGRDLKLLPVALDRVSTPNRGNGFAIADDKRTVTFGGGGGPVAFDMVAKLPETERPITGLRMIFHPEKNGRGLGSGIAGAGKTDRGGFVLSAVFISADATPVEQVNLFRLQKFAGVTADQWLPQWRPEGVLEALPSSGWAPDPATDGPARLTLTFEQPLDAAKSPWVTVQAFFGTGANRVASRVELQAITGVDDDSDLPPDVIAAVLAAEGAQSAAVREHFAAHASATLRDRVDLANARERLDVLRKEFPVMVMAVADKPRATFILHRGDYQQPGEQVEEGVPNALSRMPEDGPRGRLGLAKWVIAPENPLTARVAVNRIWQLLWGTGIVRTAADFGAQGEYPSHPELLDWLAADFRDHGWDVKRLVRQIVMSAAWRQSSVPPAGMLERDPQNRLLARGPRFRLPAEIIRDNALAVSGLLVPRIGGPSVNAYAPGDLWREVSHYGSTPATAQTFVQDHGEKLYRRSLYTYWKRTAPPPNMAAFDAPSREVCVVTRSATNTPLQALVMLNDVQFVEAARAFAERVLKQPGNDAQRLRYAFLAATSRAPSAEEISVLTKALARESARYAADRKAAGALLAMGESPRDEAIPAERHAAWTQVCSLLLNLSESITLN